MRHKVVGPNCRGESSVYMYYQKEMELAIEVVTVKMEKSIILKLPVHCSRWRLQAAILPCSEEKCLQKHVYTLAVGCFFFLFAAVLHYNNNCCAKFKINTFLIDSTIIAHTFGTEKHHFDQELPLSSIHKG